MGSWADSLDYFESTAVYEVDSAMAARSALGFGFETGSAIEGCF